MAKAKKTPGVHPALLKPMGNPKPIKLTDAERKAAQRETEKVKKSPRKPGKDVPCY